MPRRPDRDRQARAVGGYRFGFSLVGLVAVLIPLVPNVLWALLPPVSSVPAPGNPAPVPLEAAGTVCQSLMIALLVLVVNTRRRARPVRRILAAVALVCLLGYLGLWALYFGAHITPTLLVMMAVLPSVYFICVSLHLENYPALVPATLFAGIHTAVTAWSYL